MVGSAGTETDPELGELRAFSDVRDFPSRVQCTMLAWDALQPLGEIRLHRLHQGKRRYCRGLILAHVLNALENVLKSA
jgi:hypothetical protein